MGEEFLLEQEVGEWMELPLWIAESNDDFRYMQQADVSRAAAAGLSIREVDDTVRDTLAWIRAEPPNDADDDDRAVGLSGKRERSLLAAWASGGAAAPK